MIKRRDMMKIIMSMLLITCVVVSAPIKEDKRSISITHSNDINLRGETSGVKTGDDLLTGVLGISYRDSEAFYEMNLKSYTQRHIANGERVDTLSLGYLRDLVSGKHMDYGYEVIVGAQLIHSGNFGGEVLQNAIHVLTGNPRYDLSFSTETHTTFGLQSRISGSYALNQNFNLYNSLAIKANIDKSGSGKLELGVEAAYESVSFWLGGVMHYIEPFKHTIVEFSTPDKYTSYAVLGTSVRFAKKYELMLETTFGGAALGEKDDYSTQFRLRYFLD